MSSHVRVLEEEITTAGGRRAGLLADITTDLASAEVPEGADSRQALAPVEETPRDEAGDEELLLELVHPIVESGTDAAEGDIAVWDQLTPSDIERAKNVLDARREEMVARHAAELKALDADQTQIKTLEEAIEAFMRKSKARPPNS